MRISVYVPCHNNESTLAEVLRALREQTRPAQQFLFINDRCTDRSPTIASDHGFEVHALAGKRGLSAGRNRALELATGDVLLGIDADAVAAPDYLEKLEEQFNAFPEFAAIGGRLDERFQESPPDLWRAVHMSQHHGDIPIMNPKALYGSTMAIRVSAARQVGGWNERFLTNFEDVDISGRLQAAGLRLLYYPGCRAWHLRRDTVQTVLRTYWNWNYHGFEDRLKTLAFWFKSRAQLYWNVYQDFRIEDQSRPQLAVVTLLFPWVWAMRDLNVVRTNGESIGNLHDLAAVFGEVLDRYAFDPGLAGHAVQHLRTVANELDDRAETRGPLHSQVAADMRSYAMQCIPDCSYGAACRSAMTSIIATKNS